MCEFRFPGRRLKKDSKNVTKVCVKQIFSQALLFPLSISIMIHTYI